MTFYLNHHQSQYQPGTSARTHAQGCTWTSGANGADASTGGGVKRTPDQILAKVPRADETDPRTPGWSLVDLDHAMVAIGVGFEVRSGQGWAGVVAAHNAGHYIALQGDSDRFGAYTCSGKFDGDHCIGVHPGENASGHWRIDDPICKDARYEVPAFLRSYAQKLYPTVRFGVFTRPVPHMTSEEPMEAFSIPQHPSIAEAKVDAGLWTSSSLTGAPDVVVKKGDTKRLIGNPKGVPTTLIIGHDRDATADGKSALYGKAVEWTVAVIP